MSQYQTKYYPLLNSKQALTQLDTNSPKAKMLAFAQAGKSCVEFGCGAGSFTQILKAQGFQVTGVEVNAVMAEQATTFCEHTIVADLNYRSLDTLFPESRFDIAFFGDVLEHLIQPQEVLKQCKQILQLDGCIIASIPNIAHGAIRLSLLQGDFNYTQYGILDDTHLRFFTKRTIISLFENAGYDIWQMDRTFLSVDQTSSLLPSYTLDQVTRSLRRRMRDDMDCNTLQYIIKAMPRTESSLSASQQLQDDSEASFQQFQDSLKLKCKKKWYQRLLKS